MPKRLPLPLQMTDVNHDQWCWAAVAASVGEFKDKTPHRQCVVACDSLNDPTCCDAGLCNVPGFLDRALSAVKHHLFTSPGVIGFGEIIAQIEGDLPIGVRVGWSGGGVGHFLAIIGYDETTNRIDVADPRFGPSTITVAELETSYKGLGNWTDTYFTI